LPTSTPTSTPTPGAQRPFRLTVPWLAFDGH
jgi:hypothetical protein